MATKKKSSKKEPEKPKKKKPNKVERAFAGAEKVLKQIKKEKPIIKVEPPPKEKIDPSCFDPESHQMRELQNMRRRDLQKACILRGMPFENVPDSTLQLQSWFCSHYDRGQNQNLLLEYDDWFELEMLNKGRDPKDPRHAHLFNPALRFSYEPSSNEEVVKATLKVKTSTEEPKRLREPKPESKKPNKSKREKVEDLGGIYSGTKKALTYQLTKDGKPIDKVIKAVMKQFPEAQEKSIKIWAARCRKEFKIK